MNTNQIPEIDDIIAELLKFSSNIIDLKPAIDLKLIEQFENDFQVKLPNDYKYLLSKINGFNLMGDEILGITNIPNDNDLADTYKFEHFEVIAPQYQYLVPFSPDGGGNFYCFDTRKETMEGNSNQIVFWYSNYEYSEFDIPEITHNSLAAFIRECIIGWALKDYDYDGSKRT